MADLTDANMEGADLHLANMAAVDLGHTDVQDTYLHLSPATMLEAALYKTNLNVAFDSCIF
jgi:uncharacterized protein YjbI with pentapeptide repeats